MRIGRPVYNSDLVMSDLVVKTYCVELDLGERLELGRKNWDKAHDKGGERVVSLVASATYIG